MRKPIDRKKFVRNNTLADPWSLMHLGSGVLFGWLMNPFAAIVLLALWEPLENFVLSPLMAKAGVLFGYETWRNAVSDIVFDGIGILIAVAFLR